MRSIYKYEVDPTRAAPALPAGAKLLTAAEQDGAIMVWAEVDTDAPLVDRKLQVVPTGGIPEGEYVGTAFIGPFVFHVYDGGE